jgi:hypothetical protein
MTSPAAEMMMPAPEAAEVAPASPASPASPAYGGARLGAAAPRAGNLVFSLGAGSALVLPQVTLDARVGLGAGTSIDVRYRNLAFYGHYVQGRFTWATPVTSRVTFGLAARTGIGSLAQADSAAFGINFSALALGNDWEVGHDIVVTWTRPGQAHVTGALGPTYSLGGPRYVTFDDSKWKLEPKWQSVTATLLGEWELTMTRRIFLRLDAMFLVKAETVPYGFLPTFTIGHAWST